MKALNVILKVVAVLAAAAGAVYAVAKWGDKIVAWAKRVMGRGCCCDDCACADCECNENGECTCECECEDCDCCACEDDEEEEEEEAEEATDAPAEAPAECEACEKDFEA